MMYCMVGLRTSLLLLILPCICLIFLSFHTLNDEIFVKDFSETVQARVFIFGKQVDNDVLYRGIANQPTPAYSSLYLSIFSFSLHFSSKISPQLYRIETSNLVYRFTTTSCIVDLKMGLLLFVLLYICSFFLSLQIFRQRYLYNRLR